MKKRIMMILCTLTVCVFTACGANNDTSKQSEDGKNEIANPFIQCDTMEDATKVAGFEMEVPDAIGEYSKYQIEAIDKDLIQVIYQKGETSLLVRKAVGSEDISGDYNDYSETNTVTVGNLEVMMKGEKGMVSVATWMDQDYSFAIDAQDSPMSSEEVSTLIESVH